MATAERSISTVLYDIVSNVQEIIRSEMRLARTEFAEELGKLRSASLLLGAGALLAIFGVLFVLLAIVYALSLVIPAWAAALVVAAAVGALGGILVGAGIKRVKAVRAAPKTTASLKENVEWAKQLTR
jgi:uncharacterized membrane protein YqjE